MAPAGKRKVCVLENIERMSLGAANAFLKTAEEPLSGRIILATTTNESGLLETIRSRAWLIQCALPAHKEVVVFLEEALAKERPDEVADGKAQKYAERLALLFADRIGLALRTIRDDKLVLSALVDEADELMQLLISKDNPQQAFILLQKLADTIETDVLLDYILLGATHT